MIEILLFAPIRLGNLARLRIDQHFHWSRAGHKGVCHLVISAEEASGPDPPEVDLSGVEVHGNVLVNVSTVEAFRDHGKLRESLTEGVDAARKTMETLDQTGISMKEMTDRLLEEGVEIFEVAFDKLLGAVEKAR